jgi:hypothetical protein
VTEERPELDWARTQEDRAQTAPARPAGCRPGGVDVDARDGA